MTNQRSRKRTWVIAIASIAALAVFGTVVLIGLAVYAFTSNVDFEDATPETAELSFQEVRAPFIREEPLIQLTGDNREVQAELRRRDRPSDVWPHVAPGTRATSGS